MLGAPRPGSQVVVLDPSGRMIGCGPPAQLQALGLLGGADPASGGGEPGVSILESAHTD
jgi:hypothetical protein